MLKSNALTETAKAQKMDNSRLLSNNSHTHRMVTVIEKVVV